MWTLSGQTNKKREALEQSLQNLLYGKDSVVEELGRALVASLILEEGQVNPALLKDIFHDSLIFLFRLVFMAYYESRFQETLSHHSSYNEYSLYEFYNKLSERTTPSPRRRISVLSAFKKTYGQVWDKGDFALGVPMLNGGLFSRDKAPLILRSKWLSNDLLRFILSRLLFQEVKTYRREYNTLSVRHLGSLYEGFLEYEFRLASEDLYLSTSKDGVEGYYNHYDLVRLGRDPDKALKYAKGDLYLSSFSNNRKTSASYYTPEVFTQFQARSAIESQRQAGKSLYDLKIMDNACGSGHYLVQGAFRTNPSDVRKLKGNAQAKKAYERGNGAYSPQLKRAGYPRGKMGYFCGRFASFKATFGQTLFVWGRPFGDCDRINAFIFVD